MAIDLQNSNSKLVVLSLNTEITHNTEIACCPKNVYLLESILCPKLTNNSTHIPNESNDASYCHIYS